MKQFKIILASLLIGLLVAVSTVIVFLFLTYKETESQELALFIFLGTITIPATFIATIVSGLLLPKYFSKNEREKNHNPKAD